ncbi:S8 family serine peptidase [Ihubacter massiliensis]|uniref:S8 family serine peptidase n=1 Tax=Hominibacterium faecale TaxID=2839743 RepID=A0A9J6QRK5_9FIRM|nr:MULTISPECIES: S8 family serine peptidase [Eubacteriales Family XIII. Incertae Sedis]MCO7123780.1 S8 family serine peptidase [Ihubacter massiliensis]MCU7378706.1 S8 family serine peptidase [Hominibacterium faecale]
MKKAISFMLIAALFTTMTFTAAPAAYAADSPSVGDSEYVKDEVLVVFEEEPSKKELRSVTDEVDAKKVEEVETPVEETPYVVTLDKGESMEDAVKDLEKEKAVAYAQPNYLYSLDAGEDNELASARAATAGKDDTDLWNLKKVDTQQSWDLIDEVKKDGQPREKVTVAVLDTGVNLEHPDLQAALNKDKCVRVVNEQDPANYPKLKVSDVNHGDNGGHGTKVSGVIAATSGNGIGVAGVAAGNSNDLIELAVIDVYTRYNSGKDRLATSADIIKGISYACDTAGAKVINMSLGHYPGDRESNSGILPDGVVGTDNLLKQTIHDAVNTKNVTIVCSAGNKNSTVSWYPSDFDDCISVISTTNYSDVYSNSKAATSGYGWKKDISAPGYLISTTQPSGGYSNNSSSGTSFAAPVVSAVAAMVYYVNPKITSNEVKKILVDTATDLYTYGDDIYTRCGNVNAFAAVSKAAGYPAPSASKLPAPVSAKAVSSGYNGVKISWSKVASAKGYQIYRSTSQSGTFNRIQTISSKNTTSYIDSGLTTGKSYYYKVRAYGTLDNKRAYSPHVMTKALPLPAATSQFSVSSKTYKSIQLKWKKVKGASGYGLYRSTSKNGVYKYIKRISRSNTTSYINSSGLKTGRTYYYKMRAYRTVSGKRIYGSYSKIYSAKAAPAKPGLALSKKSSKSVKVRWSKLSKVDGYSIYRSTSKNGKYRRIKTKSSRSSRYLIDKKVKKKKTYYYKARAYKRVKGKTIYGKYTAPKKIGL